MKQQKENVTDRNGLIENTKMLEKKVIERFIGRATMKQNTEQLKKIEGIKKLLKHIHAGCHDEERFYYSTRECSYSIDGQDETFDRVAKEIADYITKTTPSQNEIKREDALSWEDFMWECFYADNSTVAEDTSQHILDNLFDKWLEKQDLYELGLTFAERVRNFWETESAKNWYFDGDELVIKKGKWVIDRYQKHLTQSKEGGE